MVKTKNSLKKVEKHLAGNQILVVLDGPQIKNPAVCMLTRLK